MNKNIVCFAILALFSTATLAASVPNTFTAGTTASAAEVNANFAALVAAVTALEDKVSPTTMAALAGTYDVFEVAIDVDNNSTNGNSIAGTATYGTVTLNANGTLQMNISNQYRELAIYAPTGAGDQTVNTSVNFFNSPTTSSGAGTWSLAGGVVTIPGAGNFAVVGQLLMHNTLDQGKSGVLIFARR